MGGETILYRRPIETLASGGGGGMPDRVRHVHSLGPARVMVPPLETGAHFFGTWPVRELPDQGLWAKPFYDSYAPPLFVLHDVMVHSSAGIIAVGGAVIDETLARTSGGRHGYRDLAKGIALRASPPRRLRGTHISVLAGDEANYRHAMLDGIARLMAVPHNYMLATDGVLVPSGGFMQADVLGLLDLLPSLVFREVRLEETLLVETLILPLSVSGEAAYHPCLTEFFARVSSNVTPQKRPMPRRFYIDRRGTGVRPLLNEGDLVAALARQGFTPVVLEDMSLSDQIRLFRSAEAIVAPHGAGLTNLGYAHPGCVVVELLMDACVDWSFRNLAALVGLRYDCVLGRARKPWRSLDQEFHRTTWEISVHHVVAAVVHALSASPLLVPAKAA